MDSKEFVVQLKREAVDSTVEIMSRELASPRQFNFSNESALPEMESLRRHMEAQTRESQRRAAWFHGLEEDGRVIVRDLLEQCAELAAFGVTTVIDGVGGATEGVFEIVYVLGDERKILNPENSEMLHDLLSEVCESDRQDRKS